jgi:NADPH-dependent glutamate synthase beta chain and related oxidoreductases
LNQLGHSVTVYERADRFGGLLMYGIPNMKLPKEVVERRIQAMRDVGIKLIANTEVGRDIDVETLRAEYDRIVICTGAREARDLDVPGRQLKGVMKAVDFLTDATNQ